MRASRHRLVLLIIRRLFISVAISIAALMPSSGCIRGENLNQTKGLLKEDLASKKITKGIEAPTISEDSSEVEYIVGPFLSKEAKEVGVYELFHEPYAWPSERAGPRLKNEPLVLPLGVSTTLKRRGAKRADQEPCRLSTFVELQLKTSTGWIDLNGSRGGFDEWVSNDKSGNTVITPPDEWEGIALNVWSCGKGGSTSILAFGEQGLLNYREYLNRYVTWRSEDMTPHWKPDGVEIASSELNFIALITGDINADEVPELVAYTVIFWKDENGDTQFSTEEIGIVWQDADTPPTILLHMSPQPAAFNVIKVAPPELNNGHPLVFASEYCCGSTGYRMQEFDGHGFSEIEAAAASYEWNVYLGVSPGEKARLRIAENEDVIWKEKEL